MERIEQIIEKEPNKELAQMLRSVYTYNIRYVNNPRLVERFAGIIEAMRIVDRKFFVPEARFRYVDEPLPIGYGQTISQPTTVARMLLLADIWSGLDVLEVGAGSGWNASLIAWLVAPGKVTTTDRIAALAKKARSNFSALKGAKPRVARLKLDFLHYDALDASTPIWKAKYGRIIITAAAGMDVVQDVQELGKQLLKQGGLLLYPTSEAAGYGALELWQFRAGELRKIYREEGYAFVPLLRATE